MRTGRWLICFALAWTFSAQGQTNTPPVTTTDTNAAERIEAEYQALLRLDDASLTEIQEMIKKWNAQQGTEIGVTSEEQLQKQVRSKIEAVKQSYQKFLHANPKHVRAMIAYGSFLEDIQEEAEGVQWWLKARDLDPKNAAVRNNLANHYSHSGEPKRAIEEYEAAIQIQPSEPVYHFNLGNTLYLFRRDAVALKGGTEAEMLERALECFRKARDLEPGNYDYATAYAETFYGLKNPNWQRAIEGWEYCFQLDLTPLQRDQVHTHLARVNLRLGKTAKAKAYLERVQSEQFQDIRQRLTDIANRQGTPTEIVEDLSPDTPVAK